MAKNELETAWKNWQENPSDAQYSHLLKRARPQIEKAIISHAGKKSLSDPVIRLRAEDLAARAFKKYDPEKARISTYLHSQLQPLTRVVHKRAQELDIPTTAWADLQNMQRVTEEFEIEEGRDPSTLELAEQTGLSPRRITFLRRFSAAGIPAGALRAHNPEVIQAFSGKKDTSDTDLWARAVYDSLGPTDQKIFEWRTGFFGKNQLSNREIAEKMGISASAVSQRAGKIADMLQKGLE